MTLMVVIYLKLMRHIGLYSFDNVGGSECDERYCT